MSTVDIDKLIDEALAELVYCGKDTLGVTDEAVLARKAVKALLATQRTTFKAELLAKMPEPYRSPNELDPKAHRDRYAEGASAGEKTMLAEITKIIKDM